ncbi:MAG: G1 family glutamic endopeptidase [Terriglobales bacterium]|jgi:peptidase A4-like protein
MQTQNWRIFSKAIAIATVTVLIVSFTTLAVAQRISGEERSAIFAGAPRIQTSVKGVTAIAGPPKGFNPLTATNRELFSYGLPQRPDQAADANAYAHWEKAMLAVQACNERTSQPGRTTGAAAQSCRATDVTPKPYTSMNARSAGTGAKANADGTSSISFYNWSGIANTNKLTKWNVNTSFDEVASVWNVPVSNHPFGNIPCHDGPWFDVTWNGIDGFSNGDVVQGGSANYWDGGGCAGSVETYGWIEWYPSYSILSINAFVSPGDDFYVVSYGASGTQEQYVYVEDITQQWSGLFGLVYQSGPGVVGSSAEYIVERPCCKGSNEFPLGNFVYEFFDYSFAYDGHGTEFYPGNPSPNTYIITMVADDGATPISHVAGYGTAGYQGKYSLWVADENCAYSGGCTP